MSSEKAIEVVGVSKCFQVFDKPSQRLKQALSNRSARFRGSKPEKHYKEFWALRDINFAVRRGESVGIVGRNGSGKSTLLQIICGTLRPTSGSVRTNGRIAALLELGSAFNPEFSGRENVFINAAVLGFSESETRKRFDSIVDFADIDGFIDQPVKTYSSGMRLRLAFAVQAQLEPAILVVDEALAVGDARFKAKCFARLHRLKEAGTSILLVSHATEQVVTHCDTALLLNAGEQVRIGEPREIVNEYLDLVFGRTPASTSDKADNIGPVKATNELQPGIEAQTGRTESPPPIQAPAPAIDTLSDHDDSQNNYATHPNYNQHEYRWGDRAALITDFKLSANGIDYPATVNTGDRLALRFLITFAREVVRPILGLTIKSKEGVTVFGTNSERLNLEHMRDAGRQGTSLQVDIDLDCQLGGGDYFVSVGLASRGPEGVTPHDRRYDSIHLNVSPVHESYGLVNMNAEMRSQSCR